MKSSDDRRVRPPTHPPSGPREVVEIHTRILRLSLAVEESRAYWQHVDPSVPTTATTAFEQRWFGAKSLERVRYLIASFAPRYDAFPGALAVLRKWSGMDLGTRQLICHWHLQLSDPIYRRFTAEFLPQRRVLREPSVDRDTAFRWVRTGYPDRWSDGTCVQCARKLLTAASEAGLLSGKDPRTPAYPKVSDHALAYLLYLLRATRFEGSLVDNPYLASVGIDRDMLGQRARSLPGVSMKQQMGLVEFDWAHPDLASWVKEVVS